MGLRMRGHVVRPEESGWMLSCLCTCCPEDGISSGSAVVGERIGCSSCNTCAGAVQFLVLGRSRAAGMDQDAHVPGL